MKLSGHATTNGIVRIVRKSFERNISIPELHTVIYVGPNVLLEMPIRVLFLPGICDIFYMIGHF